MCCVVCNRKRSLRFFTSAAFFLRSFVLSDKHMYVGVCTSYDMIAIVVCPSVHSSLITHFSRSIVLCCRVCVHFAVVYYILPSVLLLLLLWWLLLLPPVVFNFAVSVFCVFKSSMFEFLDFFHTMPCRANDHSFIYSFNYILLVFSSSVFLTIRFDRRCTLEERWKNVDISICKKFNVDKFPCKKIDVEDFS